jgi:hypothetical protein
MQPLKQHHVNETTFLSRRETYTGACDALF